MTINFKKKNESEGELSTVAHKLFWNVCIWLVLGDLFLWSVNKLARATTKWTKILWQTLDAFDLLHSSFTWIPAIFSMGNTAQHCRLVFFQDSDFAGDLEDSKSTSGGLSCIFGSQTFASLRWMCKKQTSVSHSSAEAVIIYLEVFHSVPNRTDGPKRQPQGNPSAVVKPNMHNSDQIKHTNVTPTNIDHIPSNTTH